MNDTKPLVPYLAIRLSSYKYTSSHYPVSTRIQGLALICLFVCIFEAVREREKTANDLAEALNEAIIGLEAWRKDKNYRLNNTEIVLAVDQVQRSK